MFNTYKIWVIECRDYGHSDTKLKAVGHVTANSGLLCATGCKHSQFYQHIGKAGNWKVSLSDGRGEWTRARNVVVKKDTLGRLSFRHDGIEGMRSSEQLPSPYF